MKKKNWMKISENQDLRMKNRYRNDYHKLSAPSFWDHCQVLTSWQLAHFLINDFSKDLRHLKMTNCIWLIPSLNIIWPMNCFMCKVYRCQRIVLAIHWVITQHIPDQTQAMIIANYQTNFSLITGLLWSWSNSVDSYPRGSLDNVLIVYN